MQQNHRIEIDQNFEVQGLFFSNNDIYLVVVGKRELFIIDNRTGLKAYTQRLPN